MNSITDSQHYPATPETKFARRQAKRAGLFGPDFFPTLNFQDDLTKVDGFGLAPGFDFQRRPIRGFRDDGRRRATNDEQATEDRDRHGQRTLKQSLLRSRPVEDNR